MKKQILLLATLAFLFLITACAKSDSQQKFQGKWIYDKEKSVAYINENIKDKKLKNFAMGMTRLMDNKGYEFKDGKIITWNGDKALNETKYDLLGSGKDWIEIKFGFLKKKFVQQGDYVITGDKKQGVQSFFKKAK